MKRRRKQRRLLLALCFVLIALFLFSGWKVYSILHGYRTAERRYNALSEDVVAMPTSLAPLPSASNEGEKTDEGEIAPPRERSPVTVDFDVLRMLCSDVVGWLYLPDTVLSYPVVQGPDNSYYLNRFLDGTPNVGGTLFADSLAPSDFSGLNTVIYGHNMRDGSMFAVVDDYAEQGFYDAHPVLYLNTPTQNYRLAVFSGFTTDPDSFVYTSAFASDDDYAAFLTALLASSEIRCDCPLSVSDRVVTLSTCTYSAEDVRFVLCAKLVEID